MLISIKNKVPLIAKKIRSKLNMKPEAIPEVMPPPAFNPQSPLVLEKHRFEALITFSGKADTSDLKASKKNIQKKKLYLFNDTSFSLHAGCRAVMRSLNYHLSDFEIIGRHYVNQYHHNESLLECCDVVLVNGEGTIHHSQNSSKYLMEVLRKAQSMKKKTLLVNSLYQEMSPDYNDVISALDFLSVRDVLSYQAAKNSGGSPVLLLDSCADPLFFDDTARPITEMPEISRGTTAGCGPYYKFIHSLKYPYYPILETEIPFERMIATVKTGKVYITGQHHAVYACGLAGSSFVAIPSNSHKIEGIIKWSNLPIPVYKNGDNMEELVKYAAGNPNIFLEFRSFLLSNKTFHSDHIKSIIQ